MHISPHNKDEAIEYLRALAFRLLMSDEVGSLDGEFAKPLWDVVGDMSEVDAEHAIHSFETTQ